MVDNPNEPKERMVEFTPQFILERGYDIKTLRFFVDGKRIDLKAIIKAYVPQQPYVEADGWIEHIEYIPDENGNMQFRKDEDGEFVLDAKGNKIPLVVPSSKEEAELNDTAIGKPVMFEPKIKRSEGKTKWYISTI